MSAGKEVLATEGTEAHGENSFELRGASFEQSHGSSRGAQRAGRFALFVVLILFSGFVVSAQNITFREITAQAGIHFTHNNGAFGKKWLPETMGPGCAFIDYDNDGWPDIGLGTRKMALLP